MFPNTFLLLLCAGCLALPVKAQSVKAYLQAGNSALERGDYYAGLWHFETLLQYAPEQEEARYKAGKCAMGFHAYPRALEHFEVLASGSRAQQWPDLYFEMARCHRALGAYEEARTYYQRYQNLPSPLRNRDYAERVAQEAEACRWALAQLALPASNWQLTRMGKEVNTPYSEFGGVWLRDTLYFASLRYEPSKDKLKPARSLSKMLLYTGERRARTLTGDIHSDDQHTGNLTFSADGNRMVYTRCQYIEDSYRIRCRLYLAERDRRGRWTRGKLLPDSINLPGFTQTQPSLGYDSLLQAELLYFVSDRPEGKGGTDLWYTWQEEGVWQTPRNLEALNTPADERTPFLHVPTQVLYFSTDGRPGMGGFDVFSSQRQDSSSWAAPQNLGLPVNSSYDDLYYSLLPNGQEGLLSSNRPMALRIDQGFDACCHDLFRLEYKPPSELPEPLDPMDPLAGNTPGNSGTPSDRSSPEEPMLLEDLLPLPLYFDNDEPDKRTRRTSTKKQYGETYTTYYQRKAAFAEVFRTELRAAQAELELDKLERFFESEVRYGQETLLRFSAQLLERLQAGDEVEIFIKGYTSPRAQSSYNLALGQRRVSSVVNHFEFYDGGALQPYLRSGQLRITQRSFGATQAPSYVIADLDDTLNSIYSIEASRERRVVIEEVRRQERD
jgi:tetratricopeptide (TPR) repeat protein